MRRLLIGILIALYSYYAPVLASAAEHSQKSVLVTGASSGIGKKIAHTLAAKGYRVYAGARKPADLKALNSIENIRSIRLDVTVQEEIDAAVDIIRNESGGLYGLVNNAGVLFAGPNIEVDIEQVKWLFDVNVFGVHRVTRAFAAMLIESGGRIVNIGSIAGNIGIKYLGSYSMSKHAIEAYSDSLAAEMALVGVQVSVIAPGDFSTNIWTRQLQKAKGPGLVEEHSPFKSDIADWIESVNAMETKNPDAVVAAVQHALFNPKPRRRYLVLPNRGEAEWVIGSAIKRLAELNTDQEYAYSADELAVMIRKAMSEEAAAN
jgi:NAD(P)-dependent dehydrogenase (short-subunit alcohol dehydrogenase family)